MAVIMVVQSQIKPGRFEDYVALSSQMKPFITRYGGSQRLIQGIAGPAPSPYETVSWVGEFESWQAYGEFMAGAQADEEFQAIVAQFLGPDAPATVLGNSIGQDIEF